MYLNKDHKIYKSESLKRGHIEDLGTGDMDRICQRGGGGADGGNKEIIEGFY